MTGDRFYGKYRGKVVANDDPNKLGRIRASCPVVLGDTTLNWALPCTPYAGQAVGFFALPPVGANVWVEFEGGDIDTPIWVGCFWSSEQVPVKDGAASTKMLKTDGLTLTVDDRQGSGGVTIEVGSPVVSGTLKIQLDQDGIVLTNGNASVKLDPSSVSLNDDALKVT
jgi:phage baseplate assembly protein gpV